MPDPTPLELVTEDGLKLASIPLEEQTDEICLAAINQNAFAISLVLIPITEEMQLAAVNSNPFSIQEIIEPTATVIETAVTNDGLVIAYIDPQTQELCDIAVNEEPMALMSVDGEFQTEAMCIEACTKFGMMIEHVKSKIVESVETVRTEPVFLAAVNNNGYALSKISEAEQTDPICDAAVKQNYNSFQYDKLQSFDRSYKALKKNGLLLEFLINKEQPDLLKLAIKQNPDALQFVPANLQTEDLVNLALNKDGMTIQYVANPTEDQAITACSNDGYAIKYVTQTEAVCIAACENNGIVLEFVTITQTVDICLAAVNNNGLALEFVTTQTQEIVDAAIAQNPDAAQFANPEFLP